MLEDDDTIVTALDAAQIIKSITKDRRQRSKSKGKHSKSRSEDLEFFLKSKIEHTI